MPPGKKRRRESPDKIVLPMVPLPRREWEYTDENPSEHFRAVLGFSEELRVLMNHVALMLPKPWGVTQQLVAWFQDIGRALDEIEKATSKGWWETGSVTIDSDGVCDLDSALRDLPDLTGKFGRSAIDRCSSNLLMMWLDEVTRRGWEIISLAIMEVDVLDGERALGQLKSMRYPVR